MFNPIELFQPGRKHTDDEQKRLELSRVDVADGDPGRGPIDLTSGKVVVRVPQQATSGPEPEPELPDTEPDQAADATPGTPPQPGT
ncbi:hypothetical protein GCM10010277_65800 [Streptomyces longisporoflavus]|uniref:DUF6191 domain-containing protein n=1 Tax=Streptomyces longisporoflavus TaxID=28044 RepID=UPI00167C9303|nr:DUF6191 domain-containing protein [Streptomyces longisporoflavus]GGV61124.1 hypothetical protein GCM10010277_65800 [Streptomyces longisporoflavus]